MLHGREPERAAIDRLTSEAAAGRGGVLVLRGEVGAGKSRLLEYAREHSEQLGLRVLQAVGIEAESELPFAGLHQLVWPLLSRLDELEPPQAAALRAALGLELGGEPDRFLVSVALLTILSLTADSEPLLLLVDDARWVDRPTLDALVFVARRLGDERIAMLVADREPEPSPFDVPGIPQLRLGGLEPEAAAALLQEAAAVPVDPQVAAVLTERTGGNPLALTELAELLTADQFAGAAPLPDPVPIGDELEDVFLERVRKLPEQTRRLLLLAATADSPDLAPILAAARQFDVPPEALPPAESARLVRAHGSEVEFRHPLVRAAVYHGASSVERNDAHLALAEVLDPETDAARRAWHRAAATVEADEDVARELERAAERAARQGALSVAASALQRAAQLSPGAEERGRRLAAAGRAAYLSGQPAAAAALLRDADPLLHDAVDRAQAALTLGEVHLTRGDAATAISVLTRGADEVAQTYADQALDLLVPAVVTIGQCLCGDVDRVVRRADALPGDGGDPLAVAYIHSTGELVRHRLGESGRLEAFVPREPSGRVPTRRYWIGVTTTHPASSAPQSEAIAFLAGLAAECRAQGLAGQLAAVLVALAYGAFQAGRFPTALADATEARTLSRDTGQALASRLASGTLALVSAVQGRGDDCRDFAREAMDTGDGDARWSHHATAVWAQGLDALGAEDPEGALFQLSEIRPGARWEQPWVTPLAAADIVEAALWAGHEDAARETAAELGAWAERSNLVWASAAAARCMALLADDPDRAVEHFEEALRRHEDIDRPFVRARTRLLYGEFLRRARRRVEAREQLRLALQGFERAGAEPWAQRARRELRATGQTLRRRDRGARDLLTPQELQIARFVARGGTNKEVAAQLFLSPRTVSSHLQSIFRKLGVATRTELAQYDFEGEEESAGEEGAA